MKLLQDGLSWAVLSALLGATGAAFTPLTCNTPGPVCDGTSPTWTSILAGDSSAEPVTIPCGSCVVMDITDGRNVTLSGVNIEGTLSFPNEARVNILTPFVYVRGTLAMTNEDVVTGSAKVNFVLTGTDDAQRIDAVPGVHAETTAACADANPDCVAGRKAVVIAGGNLKVDGMPDNCATWAKLHDVVMEGPATPSPEEWSPEEPPSECDRVVLEDTFDDGTHGHWRGNLGAHFSVMTDDDGTSYFSVHDRSREWQGPYIDLLKARNCLKAGTTYLFHAVIRLSRPDGEMSQCSTTGEKCPRLVSFSRDQYDRERQYNKMSLQAVDGLVDGEWTVMRGQIKFHDFEVARESIFETLYIEGPEAGVDIHVDSFSLSLPDEEMYPTEESQACTDLVMNGDADSYEDMTFPFKSERAEARLSIQHETYTDAENRTSSNPYFALTDRLSKYDFITWDFAPGCAVEHAVYKFTVRIRLPGTDVPQNTWFRLGRVRQDGSWAGDPWIVSCGKVGSEWQECTDYIVFDEGYVNMSRLFFRGVTERDDMITDVHFDSFAVTYHSGPVTGLVLQETNNGVSNCWGSGSEIITTSQTLRWQDSNEHKIAAIMPGANGLVTLNLEEPIVKPPTEQDSEDYAAIEVALISRAIKFTTDAAEGDALGGSIRVVKTPGVEQHMGGVEIDGYGQLGNKGFYPFSFYMSGDVEGSIISKNTVRRSKQRCYNVHGTNNTIFSENVAYDNVGLCFNLEDAIEEGNRFQGNLVAKLRRMDWTNSNKLGSRDVYCTAYYITNPTNYFEGNVAAGSQSHGFWLDLQYRPRGESASDDNRNVRPRTKPLGSFEENIAHSNEWAGVVVYPEMAPAEPAVFRDVKSYKNKGEGIKFHNSKNMHVSGGVFADCRKQIDIDRSDNTIVEDVSVVGYSPDFRVIALGHNTDKHCPSEHPLIGIEMHTFMNRGSNDFGSNIRRASFAHLGDDTECVGSSAIAFGDERRTTHWDYVTSMSEITFDEYTDLRTVNVCSAKNIDVDDLVIADLDNSLNPNPDSSSTGPSAVISNNSALVAIIGEANCSPMEGSCAQYCEDTCLRTVTFATDAGSSEGILLKVTSEDGSKTALISWNFHTGSEWQNYEYYRLRMFSAPLPAGNWILEFVEGDGETPTYPLYVRTIEEQIPDCSGYYSNFTLVIPEVDATSCSELLPNGDLENGLNPFRHRGGGLQLLNSGFESDHSLASWTRWGYHDAPGVYLDKRCLQAMVGHSYEISAKARGFVENPNEKNDTSTPYPCDPNAGHGAEYKCPHATFQVTNIDTDTGVFHNRYPQPMAQATRSGDADENGLLGATGEWWDMHGIFSVTQEMADADFVFMYFENMKQRHGIVMDNWSVKSMQTPGDRSGGMCPDGIVQNGDLEMESAYFWGTHGSNSKVKVESMVGPSDSESTVIRDYNRGSLWEGIAVRLNPGCITQGTRYELTAKFKLVIPNSDGTEVPFECDPHYEAWEVRCPDAKMKAWKAGFNDEYSDLAKTVAPFQVGEWNTIHGVFEGTEQMASGDGLELYFQYPPKNVDMIFDDVSIVEAGARDCGSVLKNPSISDGTLTSWKPHGSSSISVATEGYDDSTAILVTSRDNYWDGVYQVLDTECLSEGDRFNITAEVKLYQAGTTTPYECASSAVDANEACPQVVLKSRSGGHEQHRYVGGVHHDWVVGEWNQIQGTVDLLYSEAMVDEWDMVVIERVNKNADIVVDNFEMIKIP